MIVHLVVAAIMVLLVLAALLGIYKAHVLSEGLTFGTSQGSLAIVAFVFAIKGLHVTLKNCFMKCEICSNM